MIRFYIFIILFGFNTAFAQQITGIVMNAVNQQPIEFVNIGIIGKNLGTVSNTKGKFNLQVDPAFCDDSIRFSSIGYDPQSIKIADLWKKNYNTIFLNKRDYDLSEVKIGPRIFEKRILGVTSKQKKIVAGFKNNLLGYECGILMKAQNTTVLKQLHINIADCSYDTIFYRLNIYKSMGEMKFENILQEPLYIRNCHEIIKDEIQVDLESKNIILDGDFLITLELVKDLGSGHLYFCTDLNQLTYFRKTSQANWEVAPIGVSISMVANVETLSK